MEKNEFRRLVKQNLCRLIKACQLNDSVKFTYGMLYWLAIFVILEKVKSESHCLNYFSITRHNLLFSPRISLFILGYV